MKNCNSESHGQETSSHYLFAADEEHSIQTNNLERGSEKQKREHHDTNI